VLGYGKTMVVIVFQDAKNIQNSVQVGLANFGE